ncbi:MAG: helix-turn-helix domain-containing protein [Thermaerobacter sp.]|nr:helix-turn-helix domain-containing protein [Thermaerobacter sp.]
MPGIGEQLRAARSARGLSLQDVQKELRIREKYLEALEAENFEEIPGLVYARGFLRSYARYLDLDPDALSTQMPTAAPAVAAEQEPTQYAMPKAAPVRHTLKPVMRRKTNRQWPWVVLPLLFLVALLYYFGLQKPAPALGGATPKTHHKTKPPKSGGGTTTPNGSGSGAGTAALTQQPSTQAPQPLGGPQDNYLAAKGPIKVTLALSGPCWVYVSTDGTTVMEATQSGGTFTWTAQQSFFIKVGNPAAATLTVDGQKIPLPGTTAESVAVQVQG